MIRNEAEERTYVCTLEEVFADATETTNVKGSTRNFEKAGGSDLVLQPGSRTGGMTLEAKNFFQKNSQNAIL